MKTVIIWDALDANIKFLVVEGDQRHLNGVYINTAGDEEDDKKQDELTKLTMDEEGTKKMLDDFPTTAVLEGAFVIVAGFLP